MNYESYYDNLRDDCKKEKMFLDAVPDIRGMTPNQVSQKHPGFLVAEPIRINGFLYEQALALIKKMGTETPIFLSPIQHKINDEARTLWRRCHLNVCTMVEQYGGTQRVGYILRRAKRSFIVGDLHSIWQSPQGELIDVSPDNLREMAHGKIEERMITLIPKGKEKDFQLTERIFSPLYSSNRNLYEGWGALLPQKIVPLSGIYSLEV